MIAERHQVDGGRSTPSAAPAAAPDPAGAAEPAAPGPQAPERVVPAERFARLLALMTRLLAACGESAEAQIPIAELRASLNLDRKVLEDDIGLLNLINFGGGCYALYAQVDGDTVVVQKETYGDSFARPARLSPSRRRRSCGRSSSSVTACRSRPAARSARCARSSRR